MRLNRAIDLQYGLKIAPLMGFPGTKLTNTRLKDNLANGDLQYQSIATLYHKYKPDFVFPMMDLTVECEALGACIRHPDDEFPSVEKILIKAPEDLKRLRIPEVGEGNRLGVFVRTLELLVKEMPSNVIKSAYVLGPLSMAGRLMGASELMMNIVMEPGFVHELLAICNELLKKYIDAFLRIGPDSVWILEPTSSLVSLEHANEFSNNYIKELNVRIKKRGVSPVIHNCGKVEHLVESFCDTGIEGLSFGSAVSIPALYSRVPEDIVVFGNLDPTKVFLQMDVNEVRAETDGLLDEMNGAPNFVLSSGCDLPPNTKLENIKAFTETARSFPWRSLD